jgi:mannose-1-phosphate guanylyltransferase
LKILVLAGGSGQRLFPFTDPPKQFRTFGSENSLLQLTLKRFLKRYPPQDIYTITSPNYEQLANSQIASVDLSLQLIVEPEPRDTAPAVAFALKTFGHAIGSHFLIAPSDHFISPDETLLDNIEIASKSHEKGVHTLFGIIPSHPHCGYGYIQHTCQLVTRFIEKPDKKIAEELIEKGCLWNSGIALFDTDSLHNQLPNSVPSISIDCLLFEHAPNLRVLPLDVAWSDLGTWKGIYDAFPKDQQGNVIFGSVKLQDVGHCLVFSEKDRINLLGHKQEVVLISKEGKKSVMPLHALLPNES